MQKKVSRMNPKDVKAAVTTEKQAETPGQEKCLQLFVQIAALKPRFLLNLKTTNPFIAVIVSKTTDNFSGRSIGNVLFN